MATTFGLRKANSACFVQTGGNEVIANATLIASQPSGQLLTFFSTVFANQAAADTAWRAIGGVTIVNPTAGTDPVAAIFTWTAAAAVPALTVAQAAADNVFEIMLAASWSGAA